MQRKPFIQLIKYGVVGVMNTFLTLFVIFLCKSVLGVNEYVSNAIGYVVGFINSFMWNKRWVFKSDGQVKREATLFFAGFLVCYGVQLLVVWLINKSWFGDVEYHLGDHFAISGYGIATLVGNVAYTVCNFLFNKLVTFHKKIASGQ